MDQIPRSRDQNVGKQRKVSSQGIQMWNMKAPALTVQKYGQSLMFKKKKSPRAWGQEICYLKVLSKGIQSHDKMEAPSPTIQKLWPSFSKLGHPPPKSRSQILVPPHPPPQTKRSCYKEYTCVIWKPCHHTLKSYDQGFGKQTYSTKNYMPPNLQFWVLKKCGALTERHRDR